MENVLKSLFAAIVTLIAVFLIRKVINKIKINREKKIMDGIINKVTRKEKKKKLKEFEELLFSLKNKGYNLEDLASNDLRIKYFLNLGFINWRKNKIRDAIKETETALSFGPEDELLIMTKCNLAYYYAQALIEEKRDQAFEYATFAKDNFDNYPTHLNWLINYAYVRYRYAQTTSEINEVKNFLGDIKKNRDATPEDKKEIDKYLIEIAEKEREILKTEKQ